LLVALSGEVEIENGEFAWGTGDDDVPVLTKYVCIVETLVGWWRGVAVKHFI